MKVFKLKENDRIVAKIRKTLTKSWDNFVRDIRIEADPNLVKRESDTDYESQNILIAVLRFIQQLCDVSNKNFQDYFRDQYTQYEDNSLLQRS